MPTPTDKAAEIKEQLRDSRRWLSDSYWPQWEKVYQNYKCEMPERLDSDGKPDPDKTHIGMPDTFSMVSRRVARVTAQIPSLNFISPDGDQTISKSVSRKVMMDWDKGGVQRWQKLHCRQAEMLGWSVRGWWWQVDEWERRRGIDISQPIDPKDLELLAKTYSADPMSLQDPAVLAKLMEVKGRRGLLDVRYLYKSFEGPRSEVMFAGDVFPKPFFRTLQESTYLIVEIVRKKDWLVKLARRFPELTAGIETLLREHPKGMDSMSSGADDDGDVLRDRLRKIANLPSQSGSDYETGSTGTGEWTLIARWTPGHPCKVAYSTYNDIYIGEIESPYDLDGMIPFTDLILNDDILGGIGDSVARINLGLQDMHNLAVNRRHDLYRQITHPILGTTDRALYDNPEILRRDLGRLIYSRMGQGSLWNVNDQAAIAAMSASMGEEGAIQRMWQMAGGDSNMSMAANVDPAQLRTATGAKLMQANSDVLTKDLVDMYHFSINADCKMMYLLNRSEMADPVPIDAARYERNYNPNSDIRKQEWITAEPIHFQVDGELIVELGSTLADDDEANVAKATNLFQMLSGNPLVNQETITKDLIIAHGKGSRLAEYLQPQQDPGPPPIKAAMSVSVDMEKMPEATQRVILQNAGITQEAVARAQEQVEQEAAAAAGMPPAGPEMAPPMGAPPEIDPQNLLAAAGEQPQ